MSDCVRLAMVGIGHVAEYQLQALTHLSGWTLVGAADVCRERNTLLPKGVPFYGSVEQLMAHCDADVFMVSTPSDSHCAIARTIIAAGNNLLLEKPCCTSAEQLDGLLQAAAARRVHLSVLFHAAHASDVEWLVGEIPALELGPIGSFSCHYSDPYQVDGKLVPTARSLGGAWMDSGINALSVIGRFLDVSHLTPSDFQCSTIDAGVKYVSRARATYQFGTLACRGTGEIITTWEESSNHKSTTLRYPESDTVVLLDHSAERVDVTRNGMLLKSVRLANGRPRLVNHYVRTLDDARRRFLQSDSNLQHAVALHRLLFASTVHTADGNEPCH